MKIFVSYSHAQANWVRDRLTPVLRGGGAEVMVDDRFRAGVSVVGQMDKIQGQADVHLLCISAEYLTSDFCRHEMERAVACDPDFKRSLNPRVRRGFVVPVRLDDSALPPEIGRPNPLYADMRDDTQQEPWNLILDRCEATLGMAAPAWLAARDETVRYLRRGQSVNLVVSRAGIAWRPLLTEISSQLVQPLACVNLEDPKTVSREGLLKRILGCFNITQRVPPAPYDLGMFAEFLSALPKPTTLTLLHFDIVPHRSHYGIDLFACLRYMIMEDRSLTLLVESHTPFSALLPQDHPFSQIEIKQLILS